MSSMPPTRSISSKLNSSSLSKIWEYKELTEKLDVADALVYDLKLYSYTKTKYISKLEDDNFIFSGYNEKKHLIEICELKNHPFYVGVQYHPEFNARPLSPSKLFSAFIQAIMKNKY